MRSHGGSRWEPTNVCDREDGKMNLRQQCGASTLMFDPTQTNRLYYLVQRPYCAVNDPEPVNNLGSNDAESCPPLGGRR
jgi:hypothetical protein